MHPDITQVSKDNVPTLEEIGIYVFKHSSRYASKSEIEPINPNGKGTDEKNLDEYLAKVYEQGQ